MTVAERAITMLRESMFLTLATSDGKTPWTAPVAFVPGPGTALHFYSAQASRHAQHIATNSQVALSIVNSEARGSEIDGLQMQAVCTVVEQPVLVDVIEHYFHTLFPNPKARAWWYRPAESFEGEGVWRMYQLTITAAYVIDTAHFEKTQVDRRIAVPLDELAAGIGVLAE